MKNKKLLVSKIDWGTVIDHIPSWQADKVLKLLDINKIKSQKDISLIILYNCPSKKYNKKDIIKLYHHYLSKEEADLICLLFPTITINYVKDSNPVKYIPNIPKRIIGKIKCPQINCITNALNEPITSSFYVLQHLKLLQCEYCDSLLEFEKLSEYVFY